MMQTAKIFQNGQSQAVRLPKAFRLTGSEAYIKKMDNVVILIPKKNPWQSLINSTTKFSKDFMSSREQPLNQNRKDFFV